MVKFAIDTSVGNILEKSDIELDNFQMLNYDEIESCNFDEQQKIVDFTLENIERQNDGRLTVPLMWNGRNCHLLGNNFELCKKILYSNLKKLKKSKIELQLLEDYFTEQLNLNIIG